MPADESFPTAPELFVPDVDAAVEFFTTKLGFALHRLEQDAGGRGVFAVVWLERSVVFIAHEALMPSMASSGQPRGFGIDIRIMVPDVDAMRERARQHSVTVVHEIGDRDYGLRDFIVQDPLGYRWRFASPIGPSLHKGT